MFTGIIEKLATIEARDKTERGIRLRIQYENNTDPVQLGESIAINGVCLTAEQVDKKEFFVSIIHETLNVTTLADLKQGGTVNLERSLKVGDRIGGHFVFGHVDGIGSIIDVRRTSEDHVLSIETPRGYENYLVEKGSVAVDGVSLTVQAVQSNFFTVAIVPYTAEATTLGKKIKGDRLNIEADTLAKYVQKNRSDGSRFSFDLDTLKKLGF